MQTHNNFDRDIAIDLILPSVAGEWPFDLQTSLIRQIMAYEGFAKVRTEDFFSEPGVLTEELQTSGIGAGVGVTALKVPGIKTSIAVLAKCKGAADLTGPDGLPIDLVCLLLYPENEGVHYLRRLSRLTRLLQNRDLCAKIRETNDADTIRSLIHSPEGWMLAA